jgi:hypothetical protein
MNFETPSSTTKEGTPDQTLELLNIRNKDNTKSPDKAEEKCALGIEIDQEHTNTHKKIHNPTHAPDKPTKVDHPLLSFLNSNVFWSGTMLLSLGTCLDITVADHNQYSSSSHNWPLYCLTFTLLLVGSISICKIIYNLSSNETMNPSANTLVKGLINAYSDSKPEDPTNAAGEIEGSGTKTPSYNKYK